MARFGFVGGTYQSDSVIADAQRTINWYPEISESGAGASLAMLYPSPGLQRFAQLPGNEVRGMYEYNGRMFAVTDRFYEVFADGTFTGYDNIPNDGLPVSMVANNANQLAICGGGQLWLFPLVPLKTASLVSVQFFPSHPIGPGIAYSRPSFQATLSSNPFAVGDTVYFSGVTNASGLNGTALIINYINGNVIQGTAGTALGNSPSTLTSTPGQATTAQTGQITTGLAGTPYMVDFLDGYFVLLLANSTMFQTSGLENGSTWDPSFIYQTNEYAGNAVSMISNLRELWIFGAKKSLVYYDSGDLNTPIQPIPGAFVEHGCNAPWSVARLDNSVFWLGSDERGRNVAWRNQGYTPVRISTHGVESIWKTYVTMSDAIGYTTSRTGHGWWHLYFPQAGTSWRYDTTTGMWHEVAFLEPNGLFSPHRSRTHVYAFEKNLVGDTSTGTIYSLTDQVSYDDVPDAPQHSIKRLRRAPHVITEHEWIFHRRMRVLLESGLGPTPPFTGPASGVMNILLTDPNGVQWVANIQDGGSWQSAPYATWPSTGGTPVTVRPFADLAYFPYQAVVYALGVDTGGNPTLTMLGPPASLSGYITELQLQTFPGGLQTRLSVVFGQLQIDPPQAAPREPRMMLRWSDDGGKSWSNEYLCGAGFAGDFRKRVEWRRLGRARDRVYEVSTTDIIPWRLVDAYLDAVPGYDQPVDRYATQIRKMA